MSLAIVNFRLQNYWFQEYPSGNRVKHINNYPDNVMHPGGIAITIEFRCSYAERLNKLSFVNSNKDSSPKSPINWILSEAEECNNLLVRTLQLRSLAGFY